MSTTDFDTSITAPEVTFDPSSQRDPATVRREYLARLARRRKRLMLIGIPFAIVALLVAGKFFSMTVVANQTVAAYTEGDYESALNSAQRQKFLNVVEQWKAPYNTGTVYLQLGLNEEARLELEQALPLASGVNECPVRSNLAIAIERIGDTHAQNGDTDAARTAWEQALAVLAQAPAECLESTSSDAMEESHVRIEEKLNPPDSGDEGDPSGDPNEGDDTGSADDEQIDELSDQLDANQNDRQDQVDEDNDQSGGGGGGGTDKPW